jgi:checkpoint serine/threonine-protein kinase
MQEVEDPFTWESAKENVMPLKCGRDVVKLNKVLQSKESFQEQTKLNARMKEIEEEIHAYDGEDPIVLWINYVKWIEENMPEDTRRKFTVLEKSTRMLKNMPQYKNDTRYIRLWIQYVSTLLQIKIF